MTVSHFVWAKSFVKIKVGRQTRLDSPILVALAVESAGSARRYAGPVGPETSGTCKRSGLQPYQIFSARVHLASFESQIIAHKNHFWPFVARAHLNIRIVTRHVANEIPTIDIITSDFL